MIYKTTSISLIAVCVCGFSRVFVVMFLVCVVGGTVISFGSGVVG